MRVGVIAALCLDIWPKFGRRALRPIMGKQQIADLIGIERHSQQHTQSRQTRILRVRYRGDAHQ